jgi:O-6-methylguanine DNA methyltransferase
MRKNFLKRRTNLSFQEKVFNIVKKIPAGSVLAYKEIAKMIGNPKAYRAIGSVLNKNYNPEIPCHRVIRSNGNIGGYNRGTKNKEKLLEAEGFL